MSLYNVYADYFVLESHESLVLSILVKKKYPPFLKLFFGYTAFQLSVTFIDSGDNNGR